MMRQLANGYPEVFKCFPCMNIKLLEFQCLSTNSISVISSIELLIWICGKRILSHGLSFRIIISRIYVNIQKIFSYVLPNTQISVVRSRFSTLAKSCLLLSTFASSTFRASSSSSSSSQTEPARSC